MTRLKFFIVAWLVYIGLCLTIGPLVSGLVVLLPARGGTMRTVVRLIAALVMVAVLAVVLAIALVRDLMEYRR